MNEVILKGYMKDIAPSHTIGGIEFDKAKLIVQRNTGVEDVVELKFKKLTNKYKENDLVFLKGNVRSYSYKVENNHNKVNIYVFTYFDVPEEDDSNKVLLEGRICKIDTLRKTKQGKNNIHFIVANNIVSENSDKRLNSYIPCIAWGSLAKEISKLKVSDKVRVVGELHSRECRKSTDDGDYQCWIAHEIFVKNIEVFE